VVLVLAAVVLAADVLGPVVVVEEIVVTGAVVSKKSFSVSGTVDGADVLTLPFWLGSAGRISRPSCLHPAAATVRATSASGRATRRRTVVEPTRRPSSIAFTP
jgi:hypothetical protein